MVLTFVPLVQCLPHVPCLHRQQFRRIEVTWRLYLHQCKRHFRRGRKTGGAGQTIPCAICHGPDLKGVGQIPGIAGRSPSYIVRQLYDFKHGTRAGSGGALMKPIVEKLTEDHMISLAAYLASLTP